MIVQKQYCVIIYRNATAGKTRMKIQQAVKELSDYREIPDPAMT